MLTLIRKARRRLLHNELLSEGVTAVSVALVALIVLLLLGTQILTWYWLALLPAAAVVVAFYRVRKRLPPLYVSAQIVDRRMNLADALSTAVFFSAAPEARSSGEVRRLQLEQAERVARGVDVRRAIPYTVPRSIYPMAALILVATSLFALRYGLTRRLDLSEPMAQILQQAFGLESPETASVAPRKSPSFGDSRPEDGEGPFDADKPSDDPSLQQGDPLEENNDTQNPTAAKQGERNSKSQDGKADAQNGDDQQQGDQRASDDQNSSNSANGEKNGQNQQSSGQNADGSSNSSSLLSKVKEAMQNLLSSMKQQSSGANQQQQQQQNAAQNGKQKGQQNGGKQQKGEKQTGQAGGEEQNPDSSTESQQAENSPGQGDDSQPASKQPGGGIGSRDGSKDVKQAEQLAAMGKITQIIGKRSATISGEATVEVQSTVQQLRTAYSDRTAQHADAGAEIGRDEIPVALESYVEQYFEQVRKQPGPKK